MLRWHACSSPPLISLPLFPLPAPSPLRSHPTLPLPSPSSSPTPRGEIRTIVDYVVELVQSPDFVANTHHTGWLDARISAQVRCWPGLGAGGTCCAGGSFWCQLPPYW